MSESAARDELRYVLGLVNEWLRFAEAKNGALLALSSGAILGVSGLLPDEPWSSWVGVYLGLLILQAAFAALFALLAFLPRVRLGPLVPKGSRSAADSIYHYDHIAKYDPTSFLARLGDELGEDTAGNANLDLAGQVVANSRIALKKYRCFTIGAWLVVSALATPVVAIALALTRDEE